MKKTNEKNRWDFPIKILMILTGLFLGIFNLTSQNTTITFESNISLPDANSLGTTDFASGAIDIITANNKVFIYTLDKILVLNQNGTSIDAIIPFDEKYGKFNSVFENSRTYIADINFMTVYYNSSANREDLFVVTPNLDIILINTANNTFDIKYSVPTGEFPALNLGHLSPLHGVCIIKYDNEHNRLYWLIKGRQVDYDPDPESPYATNEIGSFHYGEVYFAIYDVGAGGNINTSPIYDFHELTKSEDMAHYRDINICDFEFNTNTYGQETYFYLAKYNEIEVWEINNTTQSVTPVEDILVDNLVYGSENGEPLYYKFSKLQYINQSGIHKIVALPYSYPGQTLADPQGHPPLIYVIDGNNYNVVNTIQSPSQRVYDAVFLPERNDLAICYSANPIDYTDPIDNTDMAFYRFDPNTGDWLDLINKLATSTNPIPGKDVNSPTNLLQVNNATLASKKDEIISLTYNNLQPPDNGYQASVSLVTGENNFFRKGVVRENPDKCFVINPGGGKIELFDYVQNSATINYVNDFKTHYPVYHITANSTGTKQYYFNKLNIENTGFFIYDAVNETVIHKNDFTSPIGDCVYNPYTNEFLLSQNNDFEGNNAVGIVRYTDDSYNTLAGTISLPDTPYGQYAKEMFIDPNGIMYVIANSLIGDFNTANKPYLLMYNATTYDYIGEKELILPVVNQDAEYYITHFCYSKSDNTVYFSVTPQELSLPPYQSEYNTMIDPNNDPTSDPTNNGSLFSVVANHVVTKEINSIENPGKIICPDDGNDDYLSVFENKIYILSNVLRSFNINSKSMESEQRVFNDIVYSPANDRLFGIADELNSNVNGNMNDRKAVVYEIFVGLPYEFDILFDYEGQIASFFLNTNDNRLYLHTKFDKHKLGGTPSQLIPFDLGTNSELQDEILDLQSTVYGQNMSAYPEFDHCPDFHYFNYNLTTPYIDPYEDKIYLPNGAHSNVSIVDINDQLLLEGGTNWISIPRHARPNNPNWTFIDEVFNQDNFTEGYNTFHLEYMKPTWNTTVPYKVDWDQQEGWSYDPNIDDNKETYSTRGYKITLDLSHQNNALQLSGILEPSYSKMKLYADAENWVGYFLHEEQNIFDALADFEDDLYFIKYRTWCCVRQLPPYGPVPPEPQYPFICNSLEPNIKYGDMVILKSYLDHIEEEDRFYWNHSGNPPLEGTDEELVYYSYTETSDYSALVIELDSTTNPVEIGAFVNDSCIGACTLTPEDTIVIIQGYLDGQSGDSVVFEEYFATKSTNNKLITDYYVYNPEKRIKEKRVISTSENKEIYYISFKPHDEQKQIDTERWFNIFPNPANDLININYRVEMEEGVNISVHDSYGRHIITLLNSTRVQGSHSMQWNLLGNTGEKLPKGLYILKLKTGGNVMSKKVVVN